MSNLSEKLISFTNKKFREFMPFGKISFRAGDAFKGVTEYLAKHFPCAKVAVLYKKDVHQSISAMVNAELAKFGIRPVSVILPNEGENDLKNLCKLFDLPEDIRAVVSFERDLFDACAYFAGVRDIPAVYAVRNASMVGMLSPQFPIFSDDKVEMVRRSCVIRVIIDSDSMLNQDNAYLLFAEIQSLLLCLVDYRISIKTQGVKINKNAYDMMIGAINRAFNVMKLKRDKQLLALIENILMAELANILSGGMIYQKSTVHSALLIAGENFSGINRILFINRVIGFFANATKDNVEALKQVPDYNSRAEELAKITGIDDGYYLNNFVGQKNGYVKKGGMVIAKLGKKLSTVCKKFNSKTDNMLKIYYAMGGLDKANNPLINKAFKYSGDLFESINCGTILREWGFLEII